MPCKLDAQGQSYTGGVGATVSGRTCQPWASQLPHQHSHHATDFPKTKPTLDNARSYCRNPDKKPEGPWCYTMEPTWEFCNISLCHGMFLCLLFWILLSIYGRIT
jgi:hypothetical protein